MRNLTLLIAVLLTLMASSCATLSRTDILTAERTRFESLKLNPDVELNNLRVDLIRQTTDVKVNDSTRDSRDTPYHPLGFDLGNGIFYDLNGNLGFRLDALMGVADKECYAVMKTSRRKQKRADRIFTFCGDRLTVRYPPSKREHYINEQITQGNTTSVMDRNRLQYAVELNDETMVYRGKRRNWEVIHKTDDNHYYQGRGWWRDHFRMEEDRLLLKKQYIIELSDDNRKISIIRPGWFGRTLLTIEKSNDQLYIYNRGYSGIRIESLEDGIAVYHNKTFMEGWKLEKGL